MSSSAADLTKLYKLQDRFLEWFVTLKLPFYLTGGTALGRFYLNHRYSNDLDFFVNDDSEFQLHVQQINKTIREHFMVNNQQSLFSEDFSRIFIEDREIALKIEFVNEVKYRAGNPIEFRYGLLDTPENILSNKISAILGRDEPKDIFDIICMAEKYSFNWEEMFYHTKNKAVINEVDVERRLIEFPVEWIKDLHWLKEPPDIKELKKHLNTIANDFLLGKDNSLAENKKPIQKARPLKI
ncbi:MAG: nucleotidyl transferase AbiEii/AbiGii toxin family protein [Bacteroidota bacterium]|nr:nucleotidyl transferase AbiEii/AbiGii toxin family protein [Bacteroidota bacterium]